MELHAHELNALTETMNCLERPFIRECLGNDVAHHDYEPLPLADFIAGVRAAEPHVNGRRFLDVGCGLGAKLGFMHYLNWNVVGIDINPKYCLHAQELYPFADITCADAFDVDHFDADLVYMYRPMVSEEDEL